MRIDFYFFAVDLRTLSLCFFLIWFIRGLSVLLVFSRFIYLGIYPFENIIFKIIFHYFELLF